jgi:hypothetical protein
MKRDAHGLPAMDADAFEMNGVPKSRLVQDVILVGGSALALIAGRQAALVLVRTRRPHDVASLAAGPPSGDRRENTHRRSLRQITLSYEVLHKKGTFP